MRVGIHPLEHLGLGLSICRSRVWLNSPRIHSSLWAVLLLLETMLTKGAVVCRAHVLVWLHSMRSGWQLTRGGGWTRSGSSLT